MKRIFALILCIASLLAICTSAASCSEYAGITLGTTLAPSLQTSEATSSNTSKPEISPTSAAPSATTLSTTDVSQRLPSPQNIIEIDYFDFRGDMNKWAERDSGGNLIYTAFSDREMILKDKKWLYPFPLYNETSGYNKGLEYAFTENGEVLKLTATDENNPGIAFKTNILNYISIGEEASGKAEFIKIRLKNHSSSTKLTLMGTHQSFGAGKLDQRVRATIEIEPSSDEWQTITVSMVDATFATTGIKAWSSSLKEFGIFPFGFSSGKSDECEAYVGAEMEIDYIVIGSYDYVTAYQSTLEKASS